MRVDFDFCDCGFANGWRAYIKSDINYGDRSTSFHATHRLSDSRGIYICWDQKVPSFEAMKAIASLWVDTTYVYIGSNDSFDEIAKRLMKYR